MPDWFDPNLFNGGMNREGMDPAGYANTPGGYGDKPNPTMQDIKNGLMGGAMALGMMGPTAPLGVLGLMGTTASPTGQPQTTASTIMGALNSIGGALGLGGTDDQQNAAGAATNPNVGGSGVEAAGNSPDMAGADRPDGPKGLESYAKGGSVSPHHHRAAGALAHMIVANPRHPVLGALARAALMHHAMKHAA